MNNYYPDEVKEIYKLLIENTKNLKLSTKYLDGRINSINNEEEIIDLLKNNLDNIEKSKYRSWYDFKYNNIYFNIKCSKCSTDNAFNKKALILSLTNNIEINNINTNINFNKFYSILNTNQKNERDYNLEYYYLYIDKIDNTIIIKSILDIQNFVSNPSNILQINWKKEKEQILLYNNNKTIEEIRKLIIQKISNSLKLYFKNCSCFLEDM